MRLKGVWLSTAALAIFIFAGGAKVSAEEIKVVKDYIKAEIKSDGAISVTEDITFNFSGKYNGVYKDISFDKGGTVSDLEISELKDKAIQFKMADTANNGEVGVYTTTKSNSNLRVKIYSPSVDEDKTFRINYRISDAAKKYNDTAELYWKFIGKNNDTAIEDLIISIVLPEGSVKENIRAYGHGPKNGKWSINDDRTIIYEVNNLTSGKYVEVRTLFPQNLLSDVSQTNDKNMLQSILKEEKSYTEEIAAQNRRMDAVINILRYCAVGLSVINVFILIMIYSKVRKPSDDFNQIYDKNIRSYDPTILAYNAAKYINNNQLTAAILELARKGYIHIEAIDYWIDGKNYKKYDFKNYEITVIREKDDKLHGHERYLLHWLFKVIGDGKRVTIEQIKQYGETHAVDFRRQFGLWQGEVKLECDKMGLINKRKSSIKLSLVLIELIMVLADIAIIAFIPLYGIISLSVTTAALISAIVINTRTVKGNVQLEVWESMRKDIKTAGNLKFKEWFENDDDFKLHMVYALSMGLMNNIALKMKPILNSYDSNYTINNIIFYSLIIDGPKHGFHTAFDSSFSDTGYSSSGDFSAGSGGGASGGGGGAGGF